MGYGLNHIDDQLPNNMPVIPRYWTRARYSNWICRCFYHFFHLYVRNIYPTWYRDAGVSSFYLLSMAWNCSGKVYYSSPGKRQNEPGEEREEYISYERYFRYAGIQSLNSWQGVVAYIRIFSLLSIVHAQPEAFEKGRMCLIFCPGCCIIVNTVIKRIM